MSSYFVALKNIARPEQNVHILVMDNVGPEISNRRLSIIGRRRIRIFLLWVQENDSRYYIVQSLLVFSENMRVSRRKFSIKDMGSILGSSTNFV